jgi:diaminopimelate epimerase
MSAQPFIKMHGLGNDFVVLDARRGMAPLDSDQVRLVSDRKFGVGCDQLITIEPSTSADAFMRIHNADGDEVEACGNATRCVASLLMAETGHDAVVIDTVVGPLPSTAAGTDRVRVDMGVPSTDWADIPLSREMDSLHLDFALEEAGAEALTDPAAANIGNPHVAFFVGDAEAVDLPRFGPLIERHPLFPDRVNVSIATVAGTDIRLRVWERGVGITRACGTAACATLVSASRRGLVGREATIHLDGGALELEWDADGHVQMTGPVATSFHGTLDASLLRPGG